jgi:hypothetical protein
MIGYGTINTRGGRVITSLTLTMNVAMLWQLSSLQAMEVSIPPCFRLREIEFHGTKFRGGKPYSEANADKLDDTSSSWILYILDASNGDSSWSMPLSNTPLWYIHGFDTGRPTLLVCQGFDQQIRRSISDAGILQTCEFLGQQAFKKYTSAMIAEPAYRLTAISEKLARKQYSNFAPFWIIGTLSFKIAFLILFLCQTELFIFDVEIG